MQIDNMENILARRKEIEGELVDMLKETESDFSLQQVKDAIFHEEDNDDMIYPHTNTLVWGFTTNTKLKPCTTLTF